MLLHKLMQLPGDEEEVKKTFDNPHALGGVYIRSAAAVVMTHICKHTWLSSQSQYVLIGDNRIDILSVNDGAYCIASCQHIYSFLCVFAVFSRHTRLWPWR